MLNKEKIDELKEQVKQGNTAQKLLNEYNELIDKKKCLEKIKKDCTSCKKISIEYAYNSYMQFEVSLPSFALEQINKIIDNEIELINNKLDELN